MHNWMSSCYNSYADAYCRYPHTYRNSDCNSYTNPYGDSINSDTHSNIFGGNSDTNAYRNSDTHANRNTDSYSNGNGCYTNAYRNSYGYTYPYADKHTYADAYRNSYGYSHWHTYTYRNTSHTYANSYGYAYSNRDTYCYTYGNAYGLCFKPRFTSII